MTGDDFKQGIKVVSCQVSPLESSYFPFVVSILCRDTLKM